MPPATWDDVAPRDLGAIILDVAPDPRGHRLNLMAVWMPPLGQAQDDFIGEISGERSLGETKRAGPDWND
jgi:hypothetical protein